MISALVASEIIGTPTADTASDVVLSPACDAVALSSAPSVTARMGMLDASSAATL